MNEPTRQPCGLTPSNTFRITPSLPGLEALEHEQEGVALLGEEALLQLFQPCSQLVEAFVRGFLVAKPKVVACVALRDVGRLAGLDPDPVDHDGHSTAAAGDRRPSPASTLTGWRARHVQRSRPS